VNDAPRLPDQIERFGGPRSWGIPQMKLQFQSSPAPERVQFVRANGDRMIQLQDTRFVYNWIRQLEEYPRHPTIRREFDNHRKRFVEFCGRASLGPVHNNQWEVTYVNHVPAGDLWSNPTEWHRVVPGLLKPVTAFDATHVESLSGEWRSILPDDRGRLHISIQSREIKGTPTLVLHLTARGAVDEANSLDSGLDLGRETIVRVFTEITSKEAHEYWGKK
jgi:uncharacterized protein (TIGR04255 family)